MLEISGIPRIRSNLNIFKDALLGALSEETSQLGSEVLALLKKRTSFPYGSLPGTYLKGPNAPKGAVRGSKSVLSKLASPIAGSEWSRQVQFYIRGPHTLHERLEHLHRATPESIESDVGYTDPAPRAVKYVLFGTKKMQGRNFLLLTFQEYQTEYLRRDLRAFQKAFRVPFPA